MDIHKIEPPERKRIYIFPGGERVEFVNVTGLEVRPSGNHRLEADGKKAIVMAGWLAIELDVDSWSL